MALQVLRNELQFVRKGGYHAPLVWRAPLLFEDSPTCPKKGCSACPDADCVLMSFVPKGCRHEAAPCRHIPMNELGETVDSLYKTRTNEDIPIFSFSNRFREPEQRWRHVCWRHWAHNAIVMPVQKRCRSTAALPR